MFMICSRVTPCLAVSITITPVVLGDPTLEACGAFGSRLISAVPIVMMISFKDYDRNLNLQKIFTPRCPGQRSQDRTTWQRPACARGHGDLQSLGRLRVRQPFQGTK